MRLSWYADTGVAVFSIWQAGMCTGTFRLPIDDLRRMIDILERGPSSPGRGRRQRASGADRGSDLERGGYPPGEDELGPLDSPAGPADTAAIGPVASHGRPRRGSDRHAQSGLEAPYAGEAYAPDAYPPAGERYPPPEGGYPPVEGGYPPVEGGYPPAEGGYPPAEGGYPPAEGGYPPAEGGYPSPGGVAAADYGAGGYGSDEYGLQPADYGAGHDASGHGPPGYGSEAGSEYGQAGYPQGDYAEGRSFQPTGHDAADYGTGGGSDAGSRDYGTSGRPRGRRRDASRADRDPDSGAGGYGSHRDRQGRRRRGEGGGFLAEPGGQTFDGPDEHDYQDERVVPPYVRGSGESYRNDRGPEAARYERDLGDTGYPADLPADSPPEDYPEPPWPPEKYSRGTDRRRR